MYISRRSYDRKLPKKALKVCNIVRMLYVTSDLLTVSPPNRSQSFIIADALDLVFFQIIKLFTESKKSYPF